MNTRSPLFWLMGAVALYGGAPAVAHDDHEALDRDVAALRAEVEALKADRAERESLAFDLGSANFTAAGFVASRYSWANIDAAHEFQLTTAKLQLDAAYEQGIAGRFAFRGGDGNGAANFRVDEGYARINWAEYFDVFPDAIEGFSFCLGRMLSPIGYEHADELRTASVTHSYLFTYAVPTHMTGLHVFFDTKYVSLFGYYTNGFESNTDNGLTGNREKHWSANLALRPTEDFSLTATVLFGNDDPDGTGFNTNGTRILPRQNRKASDQTVIYDFVGSFSFKNLDVGPLSGVTLAAEYNAATQAAGSTFNRLVPDTNDLDLDGNTTELIANPYGVGTNQQDGTWDGFAGYFIYDLNELTTAFNGWSVGYRYDFLDDEKGILTSVAQRLDSHTLWLSWRPDDHLTIKFEWRQDETDSIGASNGGLVAAAGATGVTSRVTQSHRNFQNQKQDRLLIEAVLSF